MQYSMISGAAVLFALAPTALSAGTAHVVNNCGFDVWYASVKQGVFTPMALLPAGGFSEAYSLPNVGVSIKLAPTASAAPTQFEFTWANGMINYDISNINGNPFEAYGMTLAPSMAGDKKFPSCQTVSCPAGVSPCTAAYNQPDDVRTMVCDQASDLTMTLCPSVSTRSVETSGSTSFSSAAEVGPTSGHGVHNRHHARHLPKK